MADQTQSLDVTVNHLLTMVRNQLSNLGSLVDTHATNVGESLDAELSDYNNMVQALEDADKAKVQLELKVIELESNLENRELEHTNQLSTLRSEFTQLKIKLETWSAMKAERDELKAMDPKALKKKLKEKSNLAAERLTGLQKSKRENGEYRRENSQLKKRVAVLEETALEAGKEVERLHNQVVRQDGDVLNKVFKGKDGLECFIYLYHWGLSFRPDNGAIKTINDSDFHIVMRTNRGINLCVSCSDYFVPFMPTCTDLEGYLPESIYDAMTEVFVDEMGKSHPYLLERMEWAKETALEDVDALTSKQLKLLAEADFYSVYSVIHLPDATLAQRVRGLSIKSATELRKTVHEKIVKPWCLENWTKEQVKAYG
ncbi:hypothetical protein [Vibrio splendidus]|uniref:hypothetical protein n=1 Tax=Vibrio splendidus TaxID=29497 RepID=UPI00076A425B|nr:hypothetical protein [Vibrio splendidus]PHX05464.1 hypothetical protein VSPL_28580 [Vibrio splendidus]